LTIDSPQFEGIEMKPVVCDDDHDPYSGKFYKYDDTSKDQGIVFVFMPLQEKKKSYQSKQMEVEKIAIHVYSIFIDTREAYIIKISSVFDM
jgi:hypothetical protein